MDEQTVRSCSVRLVAVLARFADGGAGQSRRCRRRGGRMLPKPVVLNTSAFADEMIAREARMVGSPIGPLLPRFMASRSGCRMVGKFFARLHRPR